MNTNTTMVRTTLAIVLLVMSLAGCAESTKKLAAAQMCASEGGTYSPETQTCATPSQVARRASDLCQAHGGYYDPTAQVCEVGRQ